MRIVLQIKETPWEGGVRTVAAIWSPLLQRRQRVSTQLMYMTDWLPTLYSATGKQLVCSSKYLVNFTVLILKFVEYHATENNYNSFSLGVHFNLYTKA